MPDSTKDLFDVVVVGGGPAGSTVGTLLADFGKRVLILEKETFPRYHIGESLLSGTSDLMRILGILDKVDNTCVRKYGVEWIWGRSRTPWKVYFKDALAIPNDFGYQVERARFDQLLLDNARAHGVLVNERSLVTKVHRHEGRVTTVEYDDHGSGSHTSVMTQWVVDASGQGGCVAKRSSRRIWDPHLNNMAIWKYWTGADLGSGVDQGNTVLVTFPEGWFWFIPLRNGSVSVGAVMDRAHYIADKDHGLDALYEQALRATPELALRLSAAQPVSELLAQRDWSYAYERFWDDGYLAVGDAACFIDPLFSTGVHLAMLSGYLAAVTLNTILDGAPTPVIDLLQFYDRAYRAEMERLREQVYFLYAGHRAPRDAYFWKARDHFDLPGIPPERAFISLIAGAYQHRSWYRRFLNQMDTPEHIRTLFNGIFDGRLLGPQMTSFDEPLVSGTHVATVNDFAISRTHLAPSQTLIAEGGRRVPLTGTLSQILALIDGRRSAAAILERMSHDPAQPPDAVRSALCEAMAYGIVLPARTVEGGVVSTHLKSDTSPRR